MATILAFPQRVAEARLMAARLPALTDAERETLVRQYERLHGSIDARPQERRRAGEVRRLAHAPERGDGEQSYQENATHAQQGIRSLAICLSESFRNRPEL